MRVTGRFPHAAGACGLMAALVLAAGLVFCAASSAADFSSVFGRSYLPDSRLNDSRTDGEASGRRINLGTHHLFIRCQGDTGPVVIVDTALGSVSLEWRHIQESLARRVSVCLYDRAGYGASEPGPLPRTSARIADELHILLERAGIAGPYVLVGHSFGGYTVQRFAGRYPASVAGVVLVDSSHPEQYERFLAAPIGLKTAPSNDRPGIRGFRFATPTLHPNLPAGVRDAVMHTLLRQPTRTAIAEEFYEFRRSAAEVREAGDLPDVPLLVLTRGRRVYPHTYRGDLMEGLWMRLQTELAARAAHSAQIIANYSGHYIHLDQPQLVVDAVSLVVDLARIQLSAARPSPAAFPAKPAWYAFEGAAWYSDGFHTRRVMGPAYPSQNGYRSPGWSADPQMLAWIGGD